MQQKENSTTLQKIISFLVLFIGIGAVLLTRDNAIREEAQDGDKVLYSASLILAVLGLVASVTAFIPRKKTDIRSLALAAMMAALCYVGFAFFKIDIPVPGSMEKTAFHFGNVFCVLAALLLGGLWGGLAGAVGMTLGDFLTGYVTSAPKTFILKLMIGLITGFMAHKVFKLDQEQNKGARIWKTAVSAGCGMLFNVIFDPIFGYFYKIYLFGLEQDLAKTLAKIGAVTTLVNAVVAVLLATVFYTALRPILKKVR